MSRAFPDPEQRRALKTCGWSLQYESLFYSLFAIGLSFPTRRAILVTVRKIAAASVAGQLLLERAAILRFLPQPKLQPSANFA